MNNRIKIDATNSFKTKYKKLIQGKPEIEVLLSSAIALIKENLNAPSLKVHKLSGKLKNKWSFSLNYQLRVVFEKKNDTIIFINIGSHDDVY